MSVCEFLHCSFSELPKRCPSLADQLLIIEYIKQKMAKESELLSSSSPPTIPKPKIPRKR